MNEITDALKKDTNTVISFDLSHNQSRTMGAMKDASVQPLMPGEMRDQTTSLVRRQSDTIEDNKPIKSIEQPEVSSSKQAETTTVVQPPESSVPEQSEQPLSMKEATRTLNMGNNYLAAVKKHQENALEQNDDLQIEQIKYNLSYRQPIPIIDDVDINIEPPLNALPAQVVALMNSTSCFLNVPVATLIPALMAAIFTATCGKFRIEVRNDYTELFNEFLIAVMPSGFNKSGIVKIFIKPLVKFIEKRQAEFDDKARNQKREMQLYKRVERKHFNKLADQVEGGDIAEIDQRFKEIEKKLEPLKNKLREVPSRPNLFSDFPTTKKLGENMKAQNEVGSILEAEGGLFKCRVRPVDDILYLKAYTGEPYGNETATNGSVILQSPCLTICSYIQPGVAADLYSKEKLKDDGLLPRFLILFCLTKPLNYNANPQDINPELMAMYENKISSILDYCWEESREGRNREIEIIRMTDNARQEYSNFSHKVKIQTHEGRFKNCEAFASKLAGHAVRLAGAVHFLEHDEPWEKPIGSSAMRSGIALAEFYAEHALFAFDKKQNDSFVYAKKIHKWVKRNRVATFEQRDAQRGVGHCKNYQIEVGIDLLQKNNYLASYLNYKGKMIYVVNPNTFREDQASFA